LALAHALGGKTNGVAPKVEQKASWIGGIFSRK
jgi:hypothetical protein